MEPRTRRVTAFYKAIDDGDLEAALSLFHDDISYVRGARSFNGLDEVADFYRRIRAKTVRSGTHDIESVTENDDAVTVRGTLHGVHADGRTIAIAFIDRHEFSDGKVRRRVTAFPGEEV